MHAHLQVIVTLRKACVLGSMCLIMMILTGFAGVAPRQVLTLALPQITQQTHLVVSNRVRIIFKTVALHVVSNPFHLIWEGLLSLAIFPRFHQQIFFSILVNGIWCTTLQFSWVHNMFRAKRYIFKANTLKMTILCAQHFPLIALRAVIIYGPKLKFTLANSPLYLTFVIKMSCLSVFCH